MANRNWGGKSVSEWLNQTNDDAPEKRSEAIWALYEMMLHEGIKDKTEAYQVGIAMAERSHDTDTSTRVRAYGLLGLLTRYLVFELLVLKKTPNLVANALHRLILKSNALHEDLLKSALPVVGHYKSTGQKEAIIAQLIQKVRNESKRPGAVHRTYRAHCKSELEKLEEL